jgi:DNA-binding XRE family transcriptional regulator
MDNLIESLKSYRSKNGLSQMQMADYLSIGYRAYQEIERTGKIKKSESYLDIMSKIGQPFDKNSAQKITATVDAGKQISENIEDILELKAGLEVLKTIVSAFAAEKKGTNAAKERLEIDKVCEEQYDFFFSELKRKRKQEA